MRYFLRRSRTEKPQEPLYDVSEVACVRKSMRGIDSACYAFPRLPSWCLKKKKTLTSERRNNSGVKPRKKQPKNIATDIKVTVTPPSMISGSLGRHFSQIRLKPNNLMVSTSRLFLPFGSTSGSTLTHSSTV